MRNPTGPSGGTWDKQKSGAKPDCAPLGLLDADFGKYVDAADAAREIAEELLANSTAYQAAVKKRDEAWANCQASESKQASNSD
jgi:hypothetical protein